MSKSAEEEASTPEDALDVQELIEFSVLREGSTEPIGPLHDADILRMLNEEELSPSDYVFYKGMADWRPIGEVFIIEEKINHFVDDGQDKERVGHIFREVSQLLSKDDELFYIAIQEKAGLLSKAKAGVAISGRYVFILNEIRTGWEIEAHPWTHISNTLMRDEGKGLGVFSILLDLEKRVDVAHLPMKQLRRLFQLSQELRDTD